MVLHMVNVAVVNCVLLILFWLSSHYVFHVQHLACVHSNVYPSIPISLLYSFYV